MPLRSGHEHEPVLADRQLEEEQPRDQDHHVARSVRGSCDPVTRRLLSGPPTNDLLVTNPPTR